MTGFLKTIFFVFLFFVSPLAHAADLNVASCTPAQYINKTTLQNIKIDFECNGDWKIILMPLNQIFFNTLNTNKTIPINRLSVKDNKEIEQKDLQPEKLLIIAQGNDFGHKTLNFTLKIINFDSDYPGDYLGDLKFTLVTNTGEIDRIYALRFNQPLIQDLKSDEQLLNVNIQEDDVFKKAQTHYLTHPTTLYVKSNKEWKLCLVAPKTNDNLKYFLKIISKPENSQSNFDKEYLELQDNQLTLLSGKETLDKQTGQLKSQIVRINYMIKTPQNEFLESGHIQKPIEYCLDE